MRCVAGVFRANLPSARRLGTSRAGCHHGEKHRFAAETAEFFPAAGTAVAWSDARTLTEPRAAALAETVKADMFTCECDSCVTCSGVQTTFLSKQSLLRNLLRVGAEEVLKRAEFN